MKRFSFLFAISATLLLTNCGPGEGTNGRTGDFDRHNHLEEDNNHRPGESRDKISDTSQMNYDKTAN